PLGIDDSRAAHPERRTGGGWRRVLTRDGHRRLLRGSRRSGVTAADAQVLVDYHYWARDRMLDALEPLPPDLFTQDLGSSFPSIRDTVVHVLAAEMVWLSRWRGVSPQGMLRPDAFSDTASVRIAWRDQEGAMRGFVRALTDEALGATIEYRSLAGQAGASV